MFKMDNRCGTAIAPKVVEKPWGYELVWAQTEKYVGKVLHINKGHSLSLQYHCVKEETIHLWRGLLKLEVGWEDDYDYIIHVLSPGDSFHLPPTLRHRMSALEECDVLEASTPQLEDVVRLKDKYGRGERQG